MQDKITLISPRTQVLPLPPIQIGRCCQAKKRLPVFCKCAQSKRRLRKAQCVLVWIPIFVLITTPALFCTNNASCM